MKIQKDGEFYYCFRVAFGRHLLATGKKRADVRNDMYAMMLDAQKAAQSPQLRVVK